MTASPRGASVTTVAIIGISLYCGEFTQMASPVMNGWPSRMIPRSICAEVLL